MPSASYFGQTGDHAGDASSRWSRRQILFRIRRDRASIRPRDRIDGSRQRVRQRLAELVVSHLSGRIARHADQVDDRDIEATQTGLVGRQDVHSAAGIMLAVERMVIFEHKRRDFGRWLLLGLNRIVTTRVCPGAI